MVQQQQSDPITAILFRIGKLEMDVKELESKFGLYTPEQVNNLRLQAIQEAIARVSADINELKESHKDLGKELTKQQEEQNKVQIRVLVGAVTTVVAILSSVLAGYITHLFH